MTLANQVSEASNVGFAISIALSAKLAPLALAALIFSV